MKALYYNELKSYQGIKLRNFPQPEISDNEVLVPVKVFSLNHLDVLVMKGKYAVPVPLPQKSFWSADRCSCLSSWRCNFLHRLFPYFFLAVKVALCYHIDIKEVNAMPDILVRDVPEKTLKQLKLKAKLHNRSLQQELKDALENLSHVAVPDITAQAAAIRKKLAGKGRKFTDSAMLLREDRCR